MEAQVVHERGCCLCIIKDSTWWVGACGFVGKAGVLWGGLWSTRRVVHQPCPQEAAGLLRSAQLSEGDVHKSTGRRTSVHQAGEGVRGRDARTLQLTSQITYPASRRTLVIGLRSSPRA